MDSWHNPDLVSVRGAQMSKSAVLKRSSAKLDDTEQRLTQAMSDQPGRWLPGYDEDGRLIVVADRDTGRLWVRSEKRWFWID